MIKGLHEEVKVVQVVPPETVTATLTTYNNTTAAAASGIDTQGFDEMLVELSLGAITGTLDVAVFDSATDDGEAATAFTDGSGTAADFDQLGSSDDDKTLIIRVRARDMKRYCFIKVTNADASSKAFGINVLLAGAEDQPVTQDNTVDFDHQNP